MTGARIWYQSLGKPEAWGGYPPYLARLIGELEFGNCIRIDGTKAGVGVHDSAVARSVKGEVLQKLREAERWRADAFIIGNFFDIGLSECREHSTIPVLGLGEVSVNLAKAYGGRIGFWCPNKAYAARVAEHLNHHFSPSYTRIIGSGDVDPVTRIGKFFSDDEKLLRFRRDVNRMLESEFKDCRVVVPAGGAAMALFDRACIGGTLGGVRIINGISGTIAFAYALLNT